MTEDNAGKPRAARGRPRREQGPKLPYEEVDSLLVEGELVVGDDGSEQRVWPSQRELAARYGVAPSLIAAYASQHHCTARKAAYQAGRAYVASAPVASAPTPSVPEKPPEVRRKPGRPRKADAPLIPFEELDKLLVFGEAEVLENGTTTTVYPTYRQLAERYGVAASVIAGYAKSHNTMRRREQAATRVAARTEEKLIELRAEAVAVGEARLVQMIDEFLLNFERALKEGRVRSDNPTDVNTLARLKAFILGGADSRQEVRGMLSLESLQERYARMLRDQREATAEMAGVLAVSSTAAHLGEGAEQNTFGNDDDVAGDLEKPPPRPTGDTVGEQNADGLPDGDNEELPGGDTP